MSLIRRIAEVPGRIRRDGLQFVFSRTLEYVRHRLSPPWENVYWIPTETVERVSPDSGLSLRVVRDLAEFDEREMRELEDSVGRAAIPVYRRRLEAGCELHILYSDGRLAGSRFAVLGAVTPFQHVILTDRDAMGLDVRIDPQQRGRGLAPLFFRLSIRELGERGIERVWASASVRNEPSNRMLKRAGFRYLLRYRIRGSSIRYDREKIL